MKTTRNARVAGKNGPHQIDVLVSDQKHALFVECKNHDRVLGKDDVSSTVYNFLDVCLGQPHLRWRLAIVSASDIPLRAQLPAAKPDEIYARVANLAGGSLAGSCRFVYFNPPSSPLVRAPFILGGDGVQLLRSPATVTSTQLESALEHLGNPAASLDSRVQAGLGLLATAPARLAHDVQAGRWLIHGLVHLGLISEAHYALRMLGALRNDGPDIETEGVNQMIGFQLAIQRYRNRPNAGSANLRKLLRLYDTAATEERLSIATFAGPALVRRGDPTGTVMLATIADNVRRLDNDYANYYEVLRLTRTAQNARSDSERAELLSWSHELVNDLPLWNRYIGECLVIAARSDPSTLHGIDSPFDATAWSQSN